MKSLIINYFSILLCAQAFFACAPDVKKTPERTFRIIHNNDGSDLLGNRWFKYRPLYACRLGLLRRYGGELTGHDLYDVFRQRFLLCPFQIWACDGRRPGRDVGLWLRHSPI